VVSPREPGSSYAVVNATLLTMAPLAARADGDARVSEDDLGIIRGGAIVVHDGRIKAVNASSDVDAILNSNVGLERTSSSANDLPVYDAGGCIVMPGLVDAHTHALFAGDRVADFEAMIAGRKPELGIAYTVEQTRSLGQDELVALGRRRLSAMLAHGTTTAEVKTGYALTADGETRLLRAIAALDAQPDLPHAIATFCGAHALPPEFATYDAFVQELVEHIVPAAASAGIARFADAFCEHGYFTPDQSRRFLVACAARGMQLRLHADELSDSGGAALAAELQCISADHLNYVDAEGVARLRASGTTAVLCPATAEYLGLQRVAPARALIEGGVPVALATDFNPGTCPCYSLQEVAHLARRRLRMTAPETLAGVTVFAARSLDAAGVAGCLAPGRPADLLLLDTSDCREFGYYFGVNVVRWAAVGRAKPAAAAR
jgi:imidazolonepropionase